MTSAQLLKKQFVMKQQARSSFSLRQFAKLLKVAPSFASGLLNGKKSIPLARLGELAQILEMDELTLNLLKQTLAEESLRAQGLEQPTGKRQRASTRYEAVSKSVFSILSPWYNVAIMDLVTCIHFRKDPKWIAGQLGISRYQVEVALQQLTQNGLLKETDAGYKKVQNKIRLSLRNSHAEIRKYHTQMIELAKLELTTKTSDLDFGRREISGITVATNPAQVAKARLKLIEALHEVAEILSEGPCSDLYQINTQLFTLLKSQGS